MSERKYSRELIDLVNDNTIKRKSWKCKKGTKLGKLLTTETSFLSDDQNIATRLYYIKKNLFNQVNCPVCNNITNIDVYNNRIKTCSISCSRKKIDEKTGLTLTESNSIKNREILSVIDEKTGKTKSELISIKAQNTLSIIDPITGKSGNILKAEKAAKTMSKIDPKSGISIYDTSHFKISITQSKVNPKTGLTGYQQVGIKNKKYMNMVDPHLGIKNSNRIQKSRLETLKIINPKTGISRQNEINIVRHKLNYRNLVVNFLENYSEYELISTETDYISQTNKKDIIYKHNCGNIINSLFPSIRCLKCYPYNRSIGENEVLEFCQTLSSNVQSNPRNIIPPLELDIYLPNHNLAIEYNGLYWHSSDSVETENKDYHLHKTQECGKRNILLFHIFENEWLDSKKQNIWKSIIGNHLGNSKRIYARKCKIKHVISKDKTKFLEDNHLQGNCQSSINFGLYYEGELISIMTFGRSRYNKKIDWELIRFCNKIGYSVVGGASRLLKIFSLNNLGSIVSYADKRRSSGNLYKILGFELSHESGPNYFYVKRGTLESRLKYQKHKLSNELEVYVSDMTESENMYRNGYRKIFDCGNQVWIYKD